MNLIWERFGEGVGGRCGSTSGDKTSHASIWRWMVGKWEHTAQSDKSLHGLGQDFLAFGLTALILGLLYFRLSSVGIKAKLQI